jgi:hypothetical protein
MNLQFFYLNYYFQNAIIRNFAPFLQHQKIARCSFKPADSYRRKFVEFQSRVGGGGGKRIPRQFHGREHAAAFCNIKDGGCHVVVRGGGGNSSVMSHPATTQSC